MTRKSAKQTLDPSIEKFYTLGLEQDRLTQGIWRLEKERTLRILARNLPPPPATILDVGGAAGAYAFPLTEQGYQVHLIDPVPLHIEQAKQYSKKTKIKLTGCSLGDARNLDQKSKSVDAVLMLGPLYHLVEQKDRLQALKEAYRILKPKGVLIAAAISRFASLVDGIYQGMLLDPVFQQIVSKDLKKGMHQSEDPKYFTTAYLHHPKELKKEVKMCGFQNVTLAAVEGPGWHEKSIDHIQNDSNAWKQLLSFLDSIESDESIIGASAHFLAIAKK